MSVKSKKPATALPLERVDTTILNEVISAEAGARPLELQRYRADHPSKVERLDKLFWKGYLQNDGMTFVATFQAIVVCNGAAAKTLRKQCALVSKILADHYKLHLNDPMSVAELSRATKITIESARLTILFLQRGSEFHISASEHPVTVSSALTASESLLTRGPFAKMVARCRDRLGQPSEQIPLTDIAQLSPGDFSALSIQNSISRLGNDEVQELFDKCTSRADSDPSGAITAARSLIEATCKQVLDGRGIEHSAGAALPQLYATVAKELELDPEKSASGVSRRVLGGCVSVVGALSELRNISGDSHGMSPGSDRPAVRHSRLATAISMAVAEFILVTDDGRKRP